MSGPGHKPLSQSPGTVRKNDRALSASPAPPPSSQATRPVTRKTQANGMDASTAFKKLRDEALCELVPLKTFGGVAAMLRQLLKVTAKQLTAEAIRSYVEAAAIYCEARAEVTVNDMESIKAATSDTQEAAKTAQRVAQEATVLLQTTTAEAQALKLQLESLAKEVQGFTQGSKDTAVYVDPL